MKKMLYLVLPAFFLAAGVNFVFAQNKEIKALSPEEVIRLKEEMKTKINGEYLDKISKQEMKDSLDKAKVETLKSTIAVFTNAQEITKGQKIDLQKMLFTDDKEKAARHVYKLKLQKGTPYILLDQKTQDESKEEIVSWLWSDFLGKYAYKFDFILIQEVNRKFLPKDEKVSFEPYLYIFITPIERNEPTIPPAFVKFENKGKEIIYIGEAKGMDTFVNGVSTPDRFVNKILKVK